jgi:hypothetical protein
MYPAGKVGLRLAVDQGMRGRFASIRSDRFRTGVAKAIPDRPASFRRTSHPTTLKRPAEAGRKLLRLLEEE